MNATQRNTIVEFVEYHDMALKLSNEIDAGSHLFHTNHKDLAITNEVEDIRKDAFILYQKTAKLLMKLDLAE